MPYAQLWEELSGGGDTFQIVSLLLFLNNCVCQPCLTYLCPIPYNIIIPLLLEKEGHGGREGGNLREGGRKWMRRKEGKAVKKVGILPTKQGRKEEGDGNGGGANNHQLKSAGRLEAGGRAG